MKAFTWIAALTRGSVRTDRSQPRPSLWPAAVAILSLSLPIPALAAPPAACKPNSGASLDCTSRLVEPYRYLVADCGAPFITETESQAQAAWEATYLPGITQCPGYTYNRLGWVPPSAPMCANGFCGAGYPTISIACGGTPYLTPAVTSAGIETSNWLVHDVEFDESAPSCTVHHPLYHWGSVRRERTTFCPRGYGLAGDYCSLSSVDVAKNLGGQCPTCGNPISPGSGNKFQKETDYVGAGPYPLRFDRYYNSLLRRDDRDNGFYGSAGTFDAFGNSAFGRLASGQGKSGFALPAGSQDRWDNVFWANVALEAIGGNWRHTYQRAIRFVQGNGTSVVTAFAYRHDGRVLSFVDTGTSFVPQADINDRLTRLPSGGWQYRDASTDELEVYDPDGRLTSITSRTGSVQTLTYDSDGRLASVSDGLGRSLTFGYAATAGNPSAINQITSVTVPGGGVYTYGYGTGGTLTSVTYPDSRSRQYQYGFSTFSRALTGIVDESGTQFATYAYDAAGQATLSEHAGGAGRVEITYADSSDISLGNATVVQAGASRTYAYTNKLGLAKISSITQPAAGGGTVSESYGYDDNGNLASKVDFKGNKSCYAYDLARNLETVRVEGFASGISCPSNLASYTPTSGTRQRKISTQWHSTYRLPTQIDESGKRTTFTYDSSGNVLTKTVLDTSASASRTWTYTYNSVGQVLTVDGPRTDVSDVTTSTYYSCTSGYQCGQLNTVTNALGHITTYSTYNVHGQPLTITDPNGVVTTLTYDARQRLTSRTVGTEQTIFDYWPTGLLKKVTLPDGSFLQYTYDGAHRLTQIEDSEGNRIVYTLDTMGNRTAEQLYDPSNALTQTRTRVFNTLNQLWKELGAAGTANVTTTFAYDNNGNQTGINAPLSRNTNQGYDELNRLTQVTDPLSGVTQYGYNALDQLISVTDPRNKVTSYTYNALGDLTQQVSPDTGTTANTYDSGGNLATSTDARSKTGTYAYDALNRVTSVTYPDQTLSYTYDSGSNQKGRLTQVSDASGSTSWTYDTHSRVLSRQQSMGVTKTLGYAHDSSGRLQTLTLPSGNTITYAYADGKITSLTLNGSTTILSNVLYQPFGPTRGWTWGNSTLAIREYDTDGKVTDIDSAGLKTYSYDDAFRITSITDASEPSLTQGYGYDKADRLVDLLAQAPEPLSIDLSTTTAAPGDNVTVTVEGIPGGSGYWLALARSGVPLTTYSKWIQVTPNSGSFVWNVTMPSFAGTYDVRLFSGGFNLETTSAAITVSAPPPPSQATLTVNASSVAPGGSVTARLANGPGGGTDWLALALVGAATGSYLQWTYVGGGVTNRDWTVTMPSTEDDYEFRLFLNNGYTLAAASGPVWVNDDAPVAGGGSSTGDYTYDANGNRLTGEGSTYTISSTSNRVMGVSGALTRTYSYDSSGNTTGDGTATFTYNDAGRMVSATKAGVTTTYALNALGQRVKKTTSGSSRHFVYDEAGHLIGEYDDSGNLIQETVWLADTPVATLRPNGGSGVNHFYVHTDHLNTPRRVSRASDNVIVWRWDGDPFGTTAANQDPDGDSTAFIYNLRFAGQYFDAETSLSYNINRDYDPGAGRYIQADPIELLSDWRTAGVAKMGLLPAATRLGNLNPVLRIGTGLTPYVQAYVYANANPLTYVDPSGLSSVAACDRFGKTGQKVCEFCVKAFCDYGLQATACCAIQKDECLGRSGGDEEEAQKCSQKFVDCLYKYRKGGKKLDPPKPPDDI